MVGCQPDYSPFGSKAPTKAALPKLAAGLIVPFAGLLLQ